MVAYCIIFLCLVEFGASYEFVQYPGFGYGSLTSTCIKGYTGESCRHKCPYPRFGSFCHEKCDCIKLLCNHIYGCKKVAASCPVGFTGKYCEKQCSYPHFGISCQKSCSCSKRRCNISTGCQFIKTVTEKTNSHKMNPFNTARSDSHKTKFFENVSSDSFKQTLVTPLIIGTDFAEQSRSSDKNKTELMGKPLQQVGAKDELNKESNTNLFFFLKESRWVQLCFALSGIMLFGLSIGHIVLSIIQCLKGNHK